MIGGEDEQVLVAQQLQPARHAVIDAAQGPGEALEVVAVAVDLVGLDQVGEHEPVVELGDQLRGRVQGALVGGAGVLDVDADPGEELTHLADRVHRHAVGLQLVQVAARGRHQRVVTPAVGALKRALGAGEWPRDHPADGVIAGHLTADAQADLIELLGSDDVDVRGDLEDRVLAGVDDEVPLGDMLGAELLDRLQAVVGPVADHPPAAGGAHDLDHRRREPVGIGGRAPGGGDAHQAPVPRGGVLAGAERPQSAVQDRRRGRRQPGERQDRAQSQTLKRGQIEASETLGEMGQRVGIRVAVLGSVRRGADAAGVEHDDERPPHRSLAGLDPVRTRGFWQPLPGEPPAPPRAARRG